MRTITVGQAPMPVTGVYFLFRKGQLQYVGQSVNVAARVGQHVAENSPLRDCDELRVFECRAEELNDWEGLFIRLLAPPANGRVAGGVHAPRSAIADRQLIEMPMPEKASLPPAAKVRMVAEPVGQSALLNRDQVSMRYGISRRWLELAAHKGEGPPMIKMSRRMVRYRPQDIEEWLRGKEVAQA